MKRRTRIPLLVLVFAPAACNAERATGPAQLPLLGMSEIPGAVDCRNQADLRRGLSLEETVRLAVDCGRITPIVPASASLATAAVAYDCTLQSEIPLSECEALVSLYNSTSGPAWSDSDGWLQTTTPCSWHGVGCSVSAGGQVSSLQLSRNQLAGPIPAEIGNLAGLSQADLSQNLLTGSIPPEVGNLTRLMELYLEGNLLTGSIPAAVGNMSGLNVLSLHSNQLSGSIPPQIGHIIWLEALLLDWNNLTGSIPPEISGTSLRFLTLEGNQLTGSIPAELSQLTRLDFLFLANNMLTGTVPRLLPIDIDFTAPRLSWVRLEGNDLSGLMPAANARWFGFWTWCFTKPGNTGLYMPDVASYRAYDLDGDGLICDVPFTADPSVVAADLDGLLTVLSAAGVLNNGQARSLTNKVDLALRMLDKYKDAQAIAALEAFIRQVNGLTDRSVLTPAQAAELITHAQIMIELVLKR